MLTETLIAIRRAGRIRRPDWWIASASGTADALVVIWTDGVNRLIERYPTEARFLSIMRPERAGSVKLTPMRSQRSRANTAEKPEA